MTAVSSSPVCDCAGVHVSKTRRNPTTGHISMAIFVGRSRGNPSGIRTQRLIRFLRIISAATNPRQWVVIIQLKKLLCCI